MAISRRNVLHSLLFGAGCVGLRALATGLPASFLLNPRKALADMCGAVTASGKAQYIIYNTSAGGDPIGCNGPGMYEDMNVVHPADPQMRPMSMTFGSQSYTAAAAWAALPSSVRNRTCFWHMMTNTPVHSQQPNVMKLNGAIQPAEMLPSLLAKQLAPGLGTLQSRPITLGARSPSEGFTFDGAALPIIPPTALQATLLTPNSPLTTLQPLRDQTLNSLYDLYRNGASPTQRAYIDSLVTSTGQVRGICQDLLSMLSTIQDDDAGSQITAALSLIKMKVTPVLAIKIPFGQDNHTDPGLALEISETISGIASINQLMSQLQSLGLQDQVSFVSLNVFGRTMHRDNPVNNNGRGHNQLHQASITISSVLKGGMIGAIAPTRNGQEFGATNINSTTGAGDPNGDIAAIDTLASFGSTLLASFGVDPAFISRSIPSGKIIQSALA